MIERVCCRHGKRRAFGARVSVISQTGPDCTLIRFFSLLLALCLRPFVRFRVLSTRLPLQHSRGQRGRRVVARTCQKRRSDRRERLTQSISRTSCNGRPSTTKWCARGRRTRGRGDPRWNVTRRCLGSYIGSLPPWRPGSENRVARSLAVSFFFLARFLFLL